MGTNCFSCIKGNEAVEKNSESVVGDDKDANMPDTFSKNLRPKSNAETFIEDTDKFNCQRDINFIYVNGICLDWDPRYSFKYGLCVDDKLYSGQIYKEKYQGYGKLETSKLKYQGMFRKGLFHGKGILTNLENNEIYEGDFKNNEFHGTGELRTDNIVYIGEYIKGQKEGNGVITYNDSRKYEGLFKDDKFHGFGILENPDGESYHGDFFKGKKHGKGTLIIPNKKKYEGSWENGKLHGDTIITDLDGKRRKVKFIEGKLVR